jgi:hypothetical protein
MEYNEFPSDYYFKLINTKQDYDKMLASGAAWEVEPMFPSSWEMHCKMKMQWEIGKWHGYKKEEV